MVHRNKSPLRYFNPIGAVMPNRQLSLELPVTSNGSIFAPLPASNGAASAVTAPAVPELSEGSSGDAWESAALYVLSLRSARPAQDCFFPQPRLHRNPSFLGTGTESYFSDFRAEFSFLGSCGDLDAPSFFPSGGHHSFFSFGSSFISGYFSMRCL